MVIQEKLIDTKFADFGETLVIAFSRNCKTCKNTYIFYGSMMGVMEGKPYSSISLSNSRKPSEMLFFVIVVYLTLT